MALTQPQLDFYAKNGYILLDNVFPEDMLEACSREYDSLFEEKLGLSSSNMEATWAGNWKDGAASAAGGTGETTSVLSIHNLQCHAAIFTQMLLHDKLVNVVSELIGSPNVVLHHTKAHVKPPEKGSPFPMHQDYHYFPFEKDSLVAVFVNLDDSDPENGGLAVYPGSHKLGPQENTSTVPTHFYVDQEKFSLEKAVPLNAKRGQVLIFSYLLIHGSYANTSTRNRRMLLFQLMSADDRALKAAHLSPCHGMVLRGVNKHQEADLSKRHVTSVKCEYTD